MPPSTTCSRSTTCTTFARATPSAEPGPAVAGPAPSSGTAAEAYFPLFDGHIHQFRTTRYGDGPEAEQGLLTGTGPWHGGAVLGSPVAGAAHLYGVAGVPVVLGYVWSVPDADIALVDAAAASGSVRGPRVCAALARLGVTHLYVDTDAPYAFPGAAFEVVPTSGVDEIATGGTAHILRVTGCD